MYNDQSTSFTAPIRDAIAPFTGFSRSFSRDKSGIKIGPQLATREALYYDMARMRSEHRCGGSEVGVLGDKDNGKSTLGKIIATEDAAVFNGLRKKRIYAENHRHIEYEELARFYNTSMIGFTERLNVFDQEVGFDIPDHQTTAETLFVKANNGVAPVGNQQSVIEAAVFKMFNKKDGEKSAEEFGRVLLGLTEDDAYTYFVSTVGLKKFTKNINWPAFMEDAGYVAQRVVTFLSGKFGKTFGGTGSIAKVISTTTDQIKDEHIRATIVNFYGKDESTTAFLISFLHRIRLAAEERGDQRFMFDTELHDEDYVNWDYAEYADITVKGGKQDRTRPNAPQSVYTTHSLLDLASTKYGDQALTHVRGIDVWFFFCMEKKIDRDATQDFFKLSKTVADRLQNLQVGQFGFKVGNEDVVFAEIALTPMRRKISFTNKTNEDALVRR